MRARLTLVSVALITGCLFDGALPGDAQLECNNDDDCPDRQVCLGLVRRCIRPGDFDGTAPALVDPLLSARALGATSVLEVSFAVDEPLLLDPLVRAGAASATPALAADGARFDATMAGAEIGAGLHAVTVVLVDASGNSGVGVIDVIEVDITPPAIIDGTLTWSVSPPAGTAPVDVGALTLGSVAELSFRLDDRTAPAPTVAASGPTSYLFEHTSSSDGFHGYRFELREVPPDGVYTVEARLVDVLGNAATVPIALPPPGFAFAEIEGPPCVARRGDGVAVCTDVDGDGHYGIDAACPEADDCDDTRALVYLGAREIPGDGIDDDCDGDDPPFDAARAVFLRPGASASAAGMQQDPLGDVAAALALATSMEQPAFVYAQGGAYDIAGTIELGGPSIIGGLDEQWRRASALTEQRVTSSGAPALVITRSARVEGVQIEGTFCEALAVRDAARSAEIARSNLRADGAGWIASAPRRPGRSS